MLSRRAVVLPALLLSSSAHAAGYFFNGVGVRGIGRAGAAVASSDDLSAQAINPAALSRLDSQVQLQLAGAHQHLYFDRTDEGEDIFDPVTNSNAPVNS